MTKASGSGSGYTLVGKENSTYSPIGWARFYKWQSLTRKLPINFNGSQTTMGMDMHGQGGQLKKCLKWYDLISYGVGSTVGAGIFVTIGVVVKEQAGPGVLLSFLFAAAACLISAFSYAEFAARIPLSGSAYTFSYASLGEFIGWFIGWNLTLEYCISASAVARGWSSYVSNLFLIFGLELPEALVEYKINTYLSFSPLSVSIILLCTFILLLGIKDSARFNMVITIINVLTISFVIILGAFNVDTNNFSPFLPFGINGAFKGAGTVFFSYIGFDSVTTLAGEVENPSRDLPIGIVGTLFIATILYIGASLVITGMVNYTKIDVNAPLSKAFEDVGLRWAAILISFGSVTALTATTLCSLLAQPRIYYQMSKDGLLFPVFGKLNKKQAPVSGIIFTGILAGTLALFLDLSTLAEMISIGTLLAFCVVCGGVLMSRYSHNTSDTVPLLSPSDRRKKILALINSLPLSALLIVFFAFSVLFSFFIKYTAPLWVILVSIVPLVVITVFVALRKETNRPLTFKAPFVPFTPLLGVLVNTFLIVQLDIYSILRVAVWSVLGISFYFFYGIRYSNLNFLEDEAMK